METTFITYHGSVDAMDRSQSDEAAGVGAKERLNCRSSSRLAARAIAIKNCFVTVAQTAHIRSRIQVILAMGRRRIGGLYVSRALDGWRT
jgi:hypothetical protein